MKAYNIDIIPKKWYKYFTHIKIVDNHIDDDEL